MCQKANAFSKKPAEPLHSIPVPMKKWSLVGMDIIGPLQLTARGNQYIVALTDHFTKFPAAKAIPSKSAENVARFMYETICTFGAFDSLITDQGREFINSVVDILTERFQINHRISSAYHPQTNGQRERDNRTLKDTLMKITDNNDWDDMLPAALFAYRTSVHKSTSFSPFFAMYGQQAKLPCDITGERNQEELNEEVMESMIGINKEIKNKLSESISRAQEKQKQYYDSRHAFKHDFKVGDKVLIINAARVHHMGGKMSPRFVGPYKIVNVLPKGRLQLQNIRTGKTLKNVYNVSTVKLFHEPSRESGPSSQGDAGPSPQGDAGPSPQGDAGPSSQGDAGPSPQGDADPSPQGDAGPSTQGDAGPFPQGNAGPSPWINFYPVDGKWQKDHASRLNFPRLYRRHPTTKPIQVEITAEPVDPVRVAGDGNCFFRTMSFILLGTESKHEDMRGILCDFMQNNDAEFFQISTCRNYVDLANMRKNGVWATEVEVFGAATLFNTPVYVFLREAADRQPR